MPASTDAPRARFRILSVDGGGIRGLISVLVLAEVERRLERRLGRPTPITDHFHLFAGTSTGGLIALALTAPKRVGTGELASFYTEDGPRIFHRGLGRELTTLWGYAGPKYSAEPLRRAIEARLGDAKVSEAARDVLLTSYDMKASEPHFFKRWRALQSGERDLPIVDAALATAAAPTYFPSHRVGERALVDGGVFANNPAVAAIAEALGRQSDEPAKLDPEDLFLVSIGTGEFEVGFSQRQVAGWGKIGWVAAGGDEPPILNAMLGGSADGAAYWAHMLLNHAPGEDVPAPQRMGRGPRYFRLQVDLGGDVAMDDVSRRTLDVTLPDAAKRLIEERGEEIDRIVELLATAPPIAG
jgi:hypothetical protein